MARRSLKPQLNQIRTWVRQGRTDAWIAHQLEVSVKEISGFKREHDLAPDDSAAEPDLFGPPGSEELDLRAEDEALVAAALEEEERKAARGEDDEDDERAEEDGGDGEESKPDAKKRRRGRRGGRGRKKGRRPLEGTFDHGDAGYGLWLDPSIQDDPLYAEHWAGHRAVRVIVEADRIVIERSGSDSGSDSDSDSDV